MRTLAVVIEQPERLGVRELELVTPGDRDVVVDVEVSGISTGTERLLYSGRMPPFPGMGYPLVPGYESVGRIVEAGPDSDASVGARVFVPGSRSFDGVRSLFGGSASRLVVPAERIVTLPETVGDEGVLLALAATAEHAMAGGALPELIIGHGTLGRLLARLTVAQGGAPVVWETDPERRSGAAGYAVIAPEDDDTPAYRTIYDASGSLEGLDGLVSKLTRGGEIVLAGFYERRLSFDFGPAFIKEARVRVAAEWGPPDMSMVATRVAAGQLSLDGLLTHRHAALHAEDAFRTAFADPTCLKMVLDWRQDV